MRSINPVAFEVREERPEREAVCGCLTQSAGPARGLIPWVLFVIGAPGDGGRARRLWSEGRWYRASVHIRCLSCAALRRRQRALF